MQDLLERESFNGLDVGIDERPARAQLRAQIGRLELELAGLLGEGFGRVAVEYRLDSPTGHPRVLDLGDLERLRDGLAGRIADARLTLRERARSETAGLELLRAMLACPQDFKWVRVTRADLGEPGCGNWHSKPRLGPIGMLMGWWRVKVSSGCPLAGRLAAVEQAAQALKEAATEHPARDPGKAGRVRLSARAQASGAARLLG